jgi:hypothetical protein
MNRFVQVCVLSFALAAIARAWESPNPPDYRQIYKNADLVVLGQPEKIILPHRASQPTKVIFRVEVVQKGKIDTETIELFHESGETKRGERIFRCPAFPRFQEGERAKVYAKWNEEKRRFEVPAYTWKVAINK